MIATTSASESLPTGAVTVSRAQPYWHSVCFQGMTNVGDSEFGRRFSSPSRMKGWRAWTRKEGEAY